MPEEPKQSPTPNQPTQAGINIPVNVGLIYTNGQTINLSQSDAQIIFNANGRPVILAAMTLPVAKHLKNSLEKAISEYERKTNTTIADINEVSDLLKKL